MSTTADGPDDNVRAQREALAATVGALRFPPDSGGWLRGQKLRGQ